MKLKLYKLLDILASFSLLVNSLYAPISAYAQEVSPSPTSTPIVEESSSLEPSSTPSEEPSVTFSPTDELATTPEASNEPTVSPTATPEGFDTTSGEVSEPSAQLSPIPEVEVEKICLTDEAIVDTKNEDWNINQVEGYAETKGKVALGTKYIFPLENNVTLTFKCLPKDESLRTSLKIQRIKISDLNLPEGTNPYGEYAYDITTGMNDGDFEYELTLPKPDNTSVEVSYIEKTIEEVRNTPEVKIDEIKQINEGQIGQDGSRVKISGLDHFSIYIATYSDGTFSVEKSIYARGETVYVKAGDLNNSKYYRITINPPGWGDGDKQYITNCQKGNVPSITGTYTLSSTADISTDWKAELKQYDSNKCDSYESEVKEDSFEVVATLSVPNPSLSQACGLDIALIVDNSTSIDSNELNQMKNAMIEFTNALSGTPTQFSATKFATTASIVQSFTSNISSVNSAINSIPVSGGYTNWEDGLLKGQSTFDPRSNPNLVIFASDGNPNRVDNGTSVSESQAVSEAQLVANAIKISGTRILVIGIGNDLDLANLQAISGNNVNTGDVLTSDVITTNFDDLADDLADFASQTCGGTITINKYVDIVSDSTRGGIGWTYHVAGPSSYSNNLTTDGNGQANTGTVAAGSGYSVVETNMLSGFHYGFATCKKQDGSSVGSVITGGIGSIAISNEDIISCDFVNLQNCHAGQHTLEGQIKGNGYTTGNLCAGGGDCWSEGENVPARLVIEGLDVGIPYSVVIEHDYQDSGVTGYENFNSASSENSTANAISLSAPTTISCGSGVTCKDYTLSFTPTSSTVQLDWNALLSDDAGQWAGGSLHYRLITGACGGVGNKEISINPNQIVILGSITPIKSASNGAIPGDWTFNISGNTSVSGIASGTTVGDLTLNANNGDVTYTITEVGPAGWVLDSVSSPCIKTGDTTATVTLSSSTPDVTCTFTNKPSTATLTLVKTVENDNGGTKTASDFQAYIDGNEVDWNVPQTLSIGSHTVNEDVLSGYSASLWGEDCAPDGTINLVGGQSKTCTITNDDIQPKLTVTKIVENNADSNGQVSDFMLYVDSTEVISGIQNGFNAGTYIVSEGSHSGYTEVIGGDCDAVSGSITLKPGDIKSCTITNNRDTGNLKVQKIVDYGDITDWWFSLDGGIAIQANASGEVDFGQVTTLDNHTIVESGPLGTYYLDSITGNNCSADILNGTATATVVKGGTTVCTFSNLINKGSITIIKDANPNDGQDFAFTTIGTELSSFNLDDDSDPTLDNSRSFTGLLPGSYTISETTPVSGWDLTSLVCNSDVDGKVIGPFIGINTASINLTAGENVTCTFTNTQRGSINVVKETIGGDDTFDFGSGTLPDSSFSITTSGNTGNTSFNNLLPGNYDVDETVPAGWNLTSTSCSDGSDPASIVLDPGETVTCTFVDTKLPTLTVNKVLNPVGYGAFNLLIDGTVYANNVGDGGTTGPQIVDVGLHTFSEEAGNPSTVMSDYIVTYGGDTGCNNNGTITLAAGENKTCTITNLAYGSILITKDVVPGDSSTWNFSVSGTGGTYTANGLADNQSYPFLHLVPGGYNINETNTNSDYITQVTCGDAGPFKQSGFLTTVNPGQTVSCTFTNTKIPTLTVTKITNPSDDAGLFNLFIDGNGVGTDISNGFTSNPLKVDIGETHSVSETAGTGTDLNDYIITFGGDCDSNGQTTLSAGDNKNCTITNTKKGTIIVKKDMVGGIDTFSFTGNLSGSISTDLGTIQTMVTPGQYTSTEDIKLGWDLDSIVCDDTNSPAGGESTGDVSTRTATFNVEAGETVTCTFTNIKRGSIQGKKFEDLNNNGSRQTNEPYLNDWTINLYQPGEIWNLIKSMSTGDDNTEAGLVDNGQYRFVDLVPATYIVCEELKTGWSQTKPSNGPVDEGGQYCYQVDLTAGQSLQGLTFGNFELGKIQGRKFNDLNANGQQDSGESPINDWTIRLYDSNWQQVGSDQTTHFISGYGDGRYRFEDLGLGTYYICEVLDSEWTQTNPSSSEGFANQSGLSDEAPRCRRAIIDESGDFITGKLFGNTEYGSISGTKYNDVNGNGQRDDTAGSEPGLSGWTINLLDESDNILGSTVTDSNGDYWFDQLLPGTYKVCEVGQTGWIQTSSPECFVITVSADDHNYNNFGNFQLGDVQGCKYNDLNGNGERDYELESQLSGWTIRLYDNDWQLVDETQTGSGDDKRYYFNDVLGFGSYYICEVMQPGWIQTEPGSDYTQNQSPNSQSEGSYCRKIDNYYSGNGWYGERFGNMEVKLELSLSKSNSLNGNIVDYSLTVENSSNQTLTIVRLTDALPGGFTYIAGSTKLDGVLFSDPTIADGTLVWEINNFEIGNKTLTYQAQISSDVPAGTYTNLAYARGIFESFILDRLDPFYSDSIATEIVSSVVTLSSSLSYSGSLTPQVLGLSTELPATGNPTIILVLAGIIGLLGVSLKIYERRKYEKN